MKRYGLHFNALFASSLLIIAVSGCGGGTQTPSEDNSTQVQPASTTYKGFGSLWSVSLNPNNTFQIVRQDDTPNPPVTDLDVSGSYTLINQTQFLDMTVTVETIDTLSQVNLNDPAVAIEVENFGLYMHAINQNTFVAMSDTTQGSCPQTPTTYNYLPLSSSDTYIGTGTYNPNGPTLTIQNYDYNGNPIGTPISATSVSCSAGVIEATINGDLFKAYLSPSGAYTAKNFSNNKIFMGVEQNAVTNIDDLNGTYSGMHFDYPLNTMTYIRVEATPPSNGNGDMTFYAIDKYDQYLMHIGLIHLQHDTAQTNLPTGFVKKDAGGGPDIICAVSVDINPNKNLLLCKEGGSHYVLYSR